MALSNSRGLRDACFAPFRELGRLPLTLHKQIAGARFRFESASEALLALVEEAYRGVPEHQLPTPAPEFRIELRQLTRSEVPDVEEPPPVRMHEAAGLVYGIMDAFNYVVLAPEQQRALVVASEDMLGQSYYLRYELIEFAVFMLIARGQGLVPLHGACVGRDGRGVLLLGASGSGKSTLAMHSLLEGLDFISEDAVFVQPQSLLATGVANYLHVQADALRFIDDQAIRDWISQAPVIRRRSGVQKFEADLRRRHARLAPAPLQLVGAVFVSNQTAENPDELLSPVPAAEIVERLLADQPYAASQPGWDDFTHQLVQAGVHELRRGRHPRASVEAVRQLLDGSRAATSAVPAPIQSARHHARPGTDVPLVEMSL